MSLARASSISRRDSANICQRFCDEADEVGKSITIDLKVESTDQLCQSNVYRNAISLCYSCIDNLDGGDKPWNFCCLGAELIDDLFSQGCQDRGNSWSYASGRMSGQGPQMHQETFIWNTQSQLHQHNNKLRVYIAHIVSSQGLLG